MNTPTEIKMVEQTEALGLYLDALFETPEFDEILEEDITPAEVTPAGETNPGDERTVIEESTLESQVQVPNQNSREWTKKEFKAVILEIDGMSVAIPMKYIRGIKEFPEELVRFEGMEPWMKGIFIEEEQEIQVVDARKYMLISNQREIDNEENQHKPELIILIGDGRWGLACQKVTRPIRIEPDQVRWKGSDRVRPWLLGVLRDQPCIVLEGEAFIQTLEALSGDSG